MSIRRLVRGPWVVSLAVLVAAGCGGDDGTTRLDDEAFCERVRALRTAADGQDEPNDAELAELRALAAVARPPSCATRSRRSCP